MLFTLFLSPKQGPTSSIFWHCDLCLRRDRSGFAPGEPDAWAKGPAWLDRRSQHQHGHGYLSLYRHRLFWLPQIRRRSWGNYSPLLIVLQTTSFDLPVTRISWRYEEKWCKIFKAPDFVSPVNKSWYLEGLSWRFLAEKSSYHQILLWATSTLLVNFLVRCCDRLICFIKIALLELFCWLIFCAWCTRKSTTDCKNCFSIYLFYRNRTVVVK